ADCRKPCVALTRGARPFVEHDRLAYRAPRDVTAGNGALRRADVLADAEIEMMIAQPFVGETFEVPELRVAGILIDECALAESGLQLVQREMAADVDQEIGGVGNGGGLTPAESGAASFALGEQRHPAVEPESIRDVREVRQVDRSIELACGARGVCTVPDLLEEIHVA